MLRTRSRVTLLALGALLNGAPLCAAFVNALQPTVLVLTTINVERNGKALLPADAFAQIAATSNRPVIVDVERISARKRAERA